MKRVLHLALPVLVGCAPTVQSAPGGPVTAQSADALMDRFAAAWSTDDRDAIAGMLAEDAIYFDANDPPVEGRAAVAASWGQAMANTDVMTITRLRSGVEDGTVYHTGRWQLTANGRVVETGVHTFIFRRGADGTWRISSAHVEDADPQT